MGSSLSYWFKIHYSEYIPYIHCKYPKCALYFFFAADVRDMFSYVESFCKFNVKFIDLLF